MAIILIIETTTRNCSVALFEDDKLINLKEKCSSDYSHSEQLTLFIIEVLDKLDFTLKNVDAVAISKGPGSYTGLRIGTSTAKGLCYSLDIPLISVSTLKAMAYGLSLRASFELFCPMIDARRMEVFSAIYDQKNNQIRDVEANIVNKDTYSDYFKKSIVFFGDGALKCQEILNHKNAYFIDDVFPSAKDLGALAYMKFIAKDFENVAYFEPYYLKDFITGKKG